MIITQQFQQLILHKLQLFCIFLEFAFILLGTHIFLPYLFKLRSIFHLKLSPIIIQQTAVINVFDLDTV